MGFLILITYKSARSENLAEAVIISFGGNYLEGRGGEQTEPIYTCPQIRSHRRTYTPARIPGTDVSMARKLSAQQ